MLTKIGRNSYEDDFLIIIIIIIIYFTFLFIYVLVQQPNGKLRRRHEYKDKTIKNQHKRNVRKTEI
jgi:hypothetical protein